jgi:hypothetical protein
MATSFYVYESIDEYNKVYGQYTQDLMFHCQVIDIYIVPNLKVIVVTNTNDQKEKANVSKTIVHCRNGVIPDELKDRAELVKYGKIVYDVKKNKLFFNPRVCRKADYETRVDRFYGNLEKGKKKIDYNHRYYDFTRDRINLVL